MVGRERVAIPEPLGQGLVSLYSLVPKVLCYLATVAEAVNNVIKAGNRLLMHLKEGSLDLIKAAL